MGKVLTQQHEEFYLGTHTHIYKLLCVGRITGVSRTATLAKLQGPGSVRNLSQKYIEIFSERYPILTSSVYRHIHMHVHTNIYIHTHVYGHMHHT